MHPLTELDYYFPTFEDNVLYALTRVHYQDGQEHPIESILRANISIIGYNQTLTFIERMLFGEESDLFEPDAADLLKITSRVEFYAGNPNIPSSDETVKRKKIQIIITALRSDCLEMRRSAIMAVENWRDYFLIDILKEHNEPAVCLSEYKNSLISKFT